MSVYNGAAFLPESIESVLAQSFRDFEFIIVNDGSTDNTCEILEKFKQADSRIQIVNNDKNIGLSASLNKGLQLVRGRFVARMDADDICAECRFEKQTEFLEQHPEIDVCGSYISAFSDTSRSTWSYPTDPLEANCHLLFNSPVAHPAVMFRKTSLQRHNLLYDPSCRAAQDYDLWARAAGYMQIANIDEVLLEYRLHDSQVGKSSERLQSEAANAVRLRLLNRLSLKPTTAELELHNQVWASEPVNSKTWLVSAGLWLGKLHRANLQEKVFPEPACSLKLARHWLDICHANRGYGLWTALRYLRSPLARVGGIGIRTKLALLRQCVSAGE
jgi:glycosyltransferase involved in cell wall biosynthesis